MPQVIRQAVHPVSLGQDRVGQAAHEDGWALLDDGFAAQHVADGGVGFGGVDVGLDLILVGGQGALDVGAVEVLHPAFAFIDGGTLFDLVEEVLGVDGDIALDVHAWGVAVLLVARVQRDPGVAYFVDGTSAGNVVHPGFNPDVFHADTGDLAAGEDADVGNAALPQQALRRFGGADAAHPVHDVVHGELDGAVDVACRDACGSEQGNLQAGGVKGVAALALQGHVRALDAAVAWDVFDAVADPVVDVDGVVAQFLCLGADEVNLTVCFPFSPRGLYPFVQVNLIRINILWRL